MRHNYYNELSKKHKDNYTKPQLKLWARMIANDIYENYDEPPNVPMITGIPKPQKKGTAISEAIAGATSAIIKAVNPTPAAPLQEITRSSSPGRNADARMKNLQQLRYLQDLFEDGILDKPEYIEQKNEILEALRKI